MRDTAHSIVCHSNRDACTRATRFRVRSCRLHAQKKKATIIFTLAVGMGWDCNGTSTCDERNAHEPLVTARSEWIGENMPTSKNEKFYQLKSNPYLTLSLSPSLSVDSVGLLVFFHVVINSDARRRWSRRCVRTRYEKREERSENK